ncbi:hypothetical protein PWG15_03185 [Ensifer adhaerens]|uniref:hypothetical protein n=1 Tax=Ensifer adhaerens TaxID=106592 RepID=UPI0023A9EF0E|nr:hypothetical protein [Ensifer adhaerens]WDZ77530.1 hypothetical protein PWG15_03185 [Ensifer adhaerens]
MITGRKSIGALAGRDLECGFTLEEEFGLLTDLAERAGWRWDEIALALLELTDEYASAHRSDLALVRHPTRGVAALKTRH